MLLLYGENGMENRKISICVILFFTLSLILCLFAGCGEKVSLDKNDFVGTWYLFGEKEAFSIEFKNDGTYVTKSASKIDSGTWYFDQASSFVYLNKETKIGYYISQKRWRLYRTSHRDWYCEKV